MKKFLIITGILILGAALFGLYEYNRGHVSNAEVGSDVALSASKLLAAFQASEEAANAKYNDKVVEVSGAVQDVLAEDGKTTLRLDAGDEMAGVTCELDGQVEHKRTDFKTGESVTLKCTCTGFLLDVVLVRCVEK